MPDLMVRSHTVLIIVPPGSLTIFKEKISKKEKLNGFACKAEDTVGCSYKVQIWWMTLKVAKYTQTPLDVHCRFIKFHTASKASK